MLGRLHSEYITVPDDIDIPFMFCTTAHNDVFKSIEYYRLFDKIISEMISSLGNKALILGRDQYHLLYRAIDHFLTVKTRMRITKYIDQVLLTKHINLLDRTDLSSLVSDAIWICSAYFAGAERKCIFLEFYDQCKKIHNEIAKDHYKYDHEYEYDYEEEEENEPVRETREPSETKSM